MNGGHVEQIGSPLELYDRPRNLFVAGFIGSPSMNLLEGRVTAIDGASATLTLADTTLSVPAAGLRDGQAVTLGVRPEHMGLAETGLPAVIRVVEPTGPELHVVLATGGQEITAVFRERHSFGPGDNVHLALDSDQLHLFDTASGNRIG